MALIVIVLSLAAAPSAGAAVVSIKDPTATPRIGGPGPVYVIFSDDVGEANDVSVFVSGPAGSLTFFDTAAPLAAGPGCTAIDAHAARCDPPLYRGTILDVQAGRGNDVVHVAGSSTSDRVDGGAGDDVLSGTRTLIGGPGRDRLLGSFGGDLLFGGPDSDQLYSRDGDDTLDPGGGDDLVDGGEGNDTLSYRHRTIRVRADLDARTAGSGTERDRLASIENAEGGAKDDSLRGDNDPNKLDGGAGADTLSGRDGDDFLTDGAGVDDLIGGDGDDVLTSSNADDRLSGGRGDDQLATIAGARADGGEGDDTLSFGGAPTVMRCGAGRDSVVSLHLTGQRLDGCEYAGLNGLRVVAKPRRRAGGALEIPVAFQRPDVYDRVAGRLELTLRRRGRRPLPLGGATFAVVEGARYELRVRPGASAAHALRRAGRHPLLAVRVTAAPAPAPAHAGAVQGFGPQPRSDGAWSIRL